MLMMQQQQPRSQQHQMVEAPAAPAAPAPYVVLAPKNDTAKTDSGGISSTTHTCAVAENTSTGTHMHARTHTSAFSTSNALITAAFGNNANRWTADEDDYIVTSLRNIRAQYPGRATGDNMTIAEARQISAELQGRTENAIKFRFKTQIKKR